ncbi:MAG: SpoIIE family protein phosphatase [Thermoflexibacter sp.]|nr:SpoIIE family protein phosphatase [Thermoflexibacter sp.]
MNKIWLYSFIFAVLFPLGVSAQEFTVIGKLTDVKGNIITEAKISVDGSAFVTTNKLGQFKVILPNKITNPDEVIVLKKHYRIKEYSYKQDKGQLFITMQESTRYFQGQVSDNANAVQGAKVTIKDANEKSPAVTDARGFFSLNLPEEFPISRQTKITVNNLQLSPEDMQVFDEYDFVYIKMPKKKTEEVAKEDNKESVTVQKIMQGVINVTTYYEDYSPAKGLKFMVEGKEFLTDSEGRFATDLKEVDVSRFVVYGYNITKFDFDNEGNYVFIVVKSDSENPTSVMPRRETLDTMIIDYQRDFNQIVNELELRKQLLAEKSIYIRDEIEKVSGKLSEERSITPLQRANLKKYLHTLETALIATDLEYEIAQEKSKVLLDKLKSTILEKDELIQKEEEEIKWLKYELIISILLGLVSIISAIILFRLSKKLKKQQEEIKVQKDEIEHSYNNIKTISDIGQKITATLDFKNLVKMVNNYLPSLVNASIFGVGVYNETSQKIEFMDFQGTDQLYHSEDMNDNRSFAAWALKNQKEVIIGDVSTEYKKYLDIPSYYVGVNQPQSLLYVPLVNENRHVGVITVQHSNKNTYTDIDVKIVETLAAYVSVALSNSNAYEVIRRKNTDITDSIRYAQTIQEAILPDDKQLDELFSEHFIIYEPKDIVSGDFFWLDYVPASIANAEIDANAKPTNFSDEIFLAVVDCTGHGVPGGFMSMVANHLLGELVNIKRIYDPASVLEQLDLRVREALKQYDKLNDDGMDICLCRVERMDGDFMKVTFAGARRPLFYYSQLTNSLEILYGDRHSIGGMHRKEKDFNNHEIILKKGDIIYLSTDGLVDQNNENREKFSTKRFQEIIQRNAMLSTSVQKAMLEEALKDHKKNEEQRDDITVVGIRM